MTKGLDPPPAPPDEYKTSLYNFLPASDADKIVEGMGNGGGRAFGMTGGRRGRGGGGGGR